MGTKFRGTICPWGQNWLRTICPEGPIYWGPIVGDHMCLGPNVSQPNMVGSKKQDFWPNINILDGNLGICEYDE